MSVTTPPARQKQSILAAFRTAPTLVKVLALILYGVGLLTLIEMAVFFAGGGFAIPQDQVLAIVVSDLLALLVALSFLLLGKGIARGSYVSWLATLIFAVLFTAQSIQMILTGFAGGRTVFRVGVEVAVLALLFTPAVRRHCPKS